MLFNKKNKEKFIENLKIFLYFSIFFFGEGKTKIQNFEVM